MVKDNNASSNFQKQQFRKDSMTNNNESPLSSEEIKQKVEKIKISDQIMIDLHKITDKFDPSKKQQVDKQGGFNTA